MKAETTNYGFWVLIFVDSLFLFVHFGGIAVIDLIVHGGILAIAACLLANQPQARSISPAWPVLFAIPLVVALIQLVPLPAWALPALAPVKYAIATAVGELVPELDLSTQITLMPGFHRLQMTTLGLDIGLALMLLIAPKPPRKVVFPFLHGLALLLAMLNILDKRGLLPATGVGSAFRGTHGGLVNPNHFAIVSAAIMVLLLVYQLGLAHRVWRDIARREIKRTMVIHLASGAVSVCCLGLTFYSFGFAYSRSGLVLFVLLLALLGGFLLREAWRLGWRKGPLIVAVLGLLGVLVLMPLGRGLAKFEQEEARGLRLEFNRVGLQYLARIPVLGTGLGSTKGLLHPLVTNHDPKDLAMATEFHNEFLQVAIEYGWLGILALAGLIFLLIRELRTPPGTLPFESRLWTGAAYWLLAAFALHGMIAFPLRVTAVRMFLMIWLAIGLKAARPEVHRGKKPRLCLSLCLALLVLVGGLAWDHVRQRKMLGTPGNVRVTKAYRYGDYFNIAKFRANEQLSTVLELAQEGALTKSVIQANRDEFLLHLREQPFSIQALNGIFMLAVLEAQIDDPDFNPARFEAFKSRAAQIRNLAEDRNPTARLATLFLLSLFRENLSLTDREVLAQLEFEFRDRIKAIKETPSPK